MQETLLPISQRFHPRFGISANTAIVVCKLAITGLLQDLTIKLNDVGILGSICYKDKSK